jgi:hypothetical protein
MKGLYSTNYKNYLIRFVISMAICLPVLTISAFAAPANDDFADAQNLAGINGSINGSNSGASRETNEPAHALNRGGASVWYKYTAPASGVLFLQATASFNTKLAVYEGTSLSNLVPVTYNDEDEFNSTLSKVYFGTKAGTTYYIAVDSKYFPGHTLITGSSLVLTYQFDDAMPNDHFVNAATLGNGLPVNSAALTNVGASKENGEPNHAGNEGGKSVWFKWSPPSYTPKSYTFSLEQHGLANPANVAFPLFAIYTGSSVDSLTEVAHTTSSSFPRLIVQAQADTTYYIAVDGSDSGAGAALGNFVLSIGITKDRNVADFDRDNRADITVFRPSSGTFYSLDSITDKFRAIRWGLNGDKPMLNDGHNDGKSDYLVFRPSNQTWYGMDGSDFTTSVYKWGNATDIPFQISLYSQPSGSYFNTYAVFRPSTGTWWIPMGFGQDIVFQFGLAGDIPMTFDYDGDGTDEIAVFRPSNGTWYLANPFTGQFIDAVNFGQSGDVPTPADFDGDGRGDIAIFRPSTGTWWIRNTQTGAQTAIPFGASGDKPQPADFDGDGKADLAVFRNGTWWIRQSSTFSVKTVQFGLSSDLPVTTPLH